MQAMNWELSSAAFINCLYSRYSRRKQMLLLGNIKQNDNGTINREACLSAGAYPKWALSHVHFNFPEQVYF